MFGQLKHVDQNTDMGLPLDNSMCFDAQEIAEGLRRT
jgi:hypothetical protein